VRAGYIVKYAPQANKATKFMIGRTNGWHATIHRDSPLIYITGRNGKLNPELTNKVHEAIITISSTLPK
jgi:hypothetical protein